MDASPCNRGRTRTERGRRSDTERRGRPRLPTPRHAQFEPQCLASRAHPQNPQAPVSSQRRLPQETPCNHIARMDLVMRRDRQVRQRHQGGGLGLLLCARFEPEGPGRDPVGRRRAKKVELSVPRRRSVVSEIQDRAACFAVDRRVRIVEVETSGSALSASMSDRR